MFIIAGLGNPTREYEGTRHNAGFCSLDVLADKYGIRIVEKKHKALIGRGMIGGRKVLLMKPQTFMNSSGESVRDALDFYKVDPAEGLIVIYDDINLEQGQLRIRRKGSAGGHNGMKSIIASLGTQEFARVRVGIGEVPEKMDLIGYVLGHFSAGEKKVMDGAFRKAAEAAVMMLDDIDGAMNAYNAKASARQEDGGKGRGQRMDEGGYE